MDGMTLTEIADFFDVNSSYISSMMKKSKDDLRKTCNEFLCDTI